MSAVSGGSHHHPVVPVMREQRRLPPIAPLSLQLPLASSSALEPLRFITAHKAEPGRWGFTEEQPPPNHPPTHPGKGDSPGKLTDSFTVHTWERKTFQPHLQTEKTGLEKGLASISSRGGGGYLGQLLQKKEKKGENDSKTHWESST